MSAFIEHLINRHLGKGEQVLPRARARFETGTAATYLPQDTEEGSNPTPTDAETLSVDSPAPETPPVNSTGDYNPIKHPGHVQYQPGTLIKPPEVKTKKMEQESGPVPQPIRGVPVELDIDNNTDNNKVSPHEPPIPANPPQESVRKRDGMSKETPAAHKYTIMNENRWEHNLENRPDPIVQTITKGLLQPLEQNPSAGFEKPANPEHTVTVNTKIQEKSTSAAPGLSPSADPPMKFMEPRPIIKESQPVTPILQDTGSDSLEFPEAAASLSGTYQPAPLEPVPSPELPMNGTGQEDSAAGSRVLLEAPEWLAGKQSQLHKELFTMESKAEAEPVINVTIGRIEVRAVKQQEPPPPRRFVPPKPKLSLDDYLEQRNRGEI